MSLPILLINKLRTAPYKCLRCLCGDAQREAFLDTGVDLEWDGRLFICIPCFMDMVRACPESYTRNEVEEREAIAERAYKEANDIILRFKQNEERLMEVGINLNLLLNPVENEQPENGTSPTTIVAEPDGLAAGTEPDNFGSDEPDPKPTESVSIFPIPDIFVNPLFPAEFG